MRKAFRKARWKKKAARSRKRGDAIFFMYKTVKNIQTSSDIMIL